MKRLIIKKQSPAVKRKQTKYIESAIQKKIVSYFRYKYPQYKSHFFSVPNSGNRSQSLGNIMKAEGMLAGVADLLLLVPNKDYSFLAIEVKTDIGKLNPNQKKWREDIEDKSIGRYEVVRSLAQFIELVDEWMMFTSF